MSLTPLPLLKNWYAALIAASWVLLTLIILSFPPARSGPLNVTMSIVGLFATATAAAYLKSRRALFFTVCIVAGAVVLAVFVAQWVLFIHAYVAVDPQPNALIAAWLFIKGRFAVPTKLFESSYPLRAFIEFYWGIGMALLQLGIITYAIAGMRSHLKLGWRVSN